MIVRDSDTGAVGVFNGSAGGVHVLVDVTGYIAGGTATADGMFVPVTPSRIADSRIPFQFGRPPPGSGTAEPQINGRGSVPATDVAAVVLNVTAVSRPTPGS